MEREASFKEEGWLRAFFKVLFFTLKGLAKLPLKSYFLNASIKTHSSPSNCHTWCFIIAVGVQHCESSFLKTCSLSKTLIIFQKM